MIRDGRKSSSHHLLRNRLILEDFRGWNKGIMVATASSVENLHHRVVVVGVRYWFAINISREVGTFNAEAPPGDSALNVPGRSKTTLE